MNISINQWGTLMAADGGIRFVYTFYGICFVVCGQHFLNCSHKCSYCFMCF